LHFLSLWQYRRKNQKQKPASRFFCFINRRESQNGRTEQQLNTLIVKLFAKAASNTIQTFYGDHKDHDLIKVTNRRECIERILKACDQLQPNYLTKSIIKLQKDHEKCMRITSVLVTPPARRTPSPYTIHPERYSPSLETIEERPAKPSKQ
jgi:hypothetical protein